MPDTLLCVGGPLNGRPMYSRTNDGFAAVDKTNNRLWLYRRDGNVWRICTDHDASLVYPVGAETGERTLDWDRVPIVEGAGPDVIPLVEAEENHAGQPVDDGWEDEEEG